MKKALFFLLLSSVMLAAPAQSAPKAQPSAPMAAGHISVAVELIGVPNKAKSTREMRSLRINLRKLAEVNGLVSVKAYFLAKDVESDKVVVNAVVTKDAEVTGGAGTTFFVESKPYILTKGKKAVKKTPATVDTGTVSFGWVVRVYQNGKLVTAAASCQGYEPWIDGH